MRVTENALNFDVDPTKAVKGAVVSGIHRPIATNPLQYQVTGIGSSAKLVEIAADGRSRALRVKGNSCWKRQVHSLCIDLRGRLTFRIHLVLN